MKPPDWEDKYIVDPTSKRPKFWNTEEDGYWKPNMIRNPEYAGKWYPQRIINKNYVGKWFPPKIQNPSYVKESSILNYTIGALGFELWQNKHGSAFDSIFISDNETEAFMYLDKTLKFLEQEKLAYAKVS